MNKTCNKIDTVINTLKAMKSSIYPSRDLGLRNDVIDECVDAILKLNLTCNIGWVSVKDALPQESDRRDGDEYWITYLDMDGIPQITTDCIENGSWRYYGDCVIAWWNMPKPINPYVEENSSAEVTK